jgi:hypothetical protein
LRRRDEYEHALRSIFGEVLANDLLTSVVYKHFDGLELADVLLYGPLAIIEILGRHPASLEPSE